ncbi:MAG: hypothetical protein HUJ42_03640 [Malacoplasma sp.]|nr:hypothetical protein [Malacoplasma sp.]
MYNKIFDSQIEIFHKIFEELRIKVNKTSISEEDVFYQGLKTLMRTKNADDALKVYENHIYCLENFYCVDDIFDEYYDDWKKVKDKEKLEIDINKNSKGNHNVYYFANFYAQNDREIAAGAAETNYRFSKVSEFQKKFPSWLDISDKKAQTLNIYNRKNDKSYFQISMVKGNFVYDKNDSCFRIVGTKINKIIKVYWKAYVTGEGVRPDRLVAHIDIKPIKMWERNALLVMTVFVEKTNFFDLFLIASAMLTLYSNYCEWWRQKDSEIGKTNYDYKFLDKYVEKQEKKKK